MDGKDFDALEAARAELARFAQLVRVMRGIQTRYLGGYDRSNQALREAREIERRVDRAVEWILTHRTGKPGAKTRQANFLDQGGQFRK